MKKALSIMLALLMTTVLCACNNEPVGTEPEENPYILVNGMTPTEFEDAIEDFIKGVYNPKNQDSIDKAVKNYENISTPTEAQEIKDTVGAYDKDKRATITNLEVDMCMPDNSSTMTYKVIATFTINMRYYKQNMLIEFTCNNKGLIDSHSLWVNNDIGT